MVLCNRLAFSSGLLIYILIILLFCVKVKISHAPTSLVLVSRCRYRYLVNKMAKQFLVVQIQCQSKILKKWYGTRLPKEMILIDIYCEFASGTLGILVIIIIIFCLICVRKCFSCALFHGNFFCIAYKSQFQMYGFFDLENVESTA